MSKIHVIIPDGALRSAIVEGLVFAGLETVEDNSGIATAFGDMDVAAIILDEAAIDKKTLKIFQDMPPSEKNRRIFYLGEAHAALADKAIESFPKPLRLGHLLSRLALHMRTRACAQSEAMIFGPWRLELQNRQIIRRDDETIIRLTEKEAALLDYLAQSAGPVSREELLAAVWGYDERINTHTLETHIYQLRRKLDPDGNGAGLLINEQGAYRLKDS